MVDIKAEKKEILRNIEELESAENRKDIEGILELVTEDFVLVYKGAKTEGSTSVRKWLERNVPNLVSSKRVPLRVEVSSSGDMAWLLGYEINKNMRHGEIVEKREDNLIIFRKVEGKWKQVVVSIS